MYVPYYNSRTTATVITQPRKPSKNAISGIIEKYAVPMLTNALRNMNEDQFHRYMNNRYGPGLAYVGNDFIREFIRNYRWLWTISLRISSSFGGVDIDVNHEVNRVVAAVHQRGWRVLPHERICFAENLGRLVRILNRRA